jgi:hypothetical protein
MGDLLDCVGLARFGGERNMLGGVFEATIGRKGVNGSVPYFVSEVEIWLDIWLHYCSVGRRLALSRSDL